MSNLGVTTENGAMALPTTFDARLDLFFKCVRDLVPTPKDEEQPFAIDTNTGASFTQDSMALIELIEKSWKVDPLDTFKILINWRDCRGGKGDRRGFIMAMKYISTTYPDWFTANIGNYAYFGRYLDLIHLWYLVDSQDHKMVLIQTIADQLKADKDADSPTLLAKWLPSENAKWDRFQPGHPRFSHALCKVLFGVRYVGGGEMKQLRQDYLAPLRKKIKLVESNLCRGALDDIRYDEVPSCAMKRYRKTFFAKDQHRFQKYLDLVKSGQSKINAKQVYPHELVAHYFNSGGLDQVIEAQWAAIKEQVEKTGAFNRAISVVDVSGSMSGVPMQVAIALGILSANESNGHKVVSFSTTPQLHTVRAGESLQTQVEAMSRMDWGMSTDLEKVFDLLLEMDPIDTVYIFSDMQFNQAVADGGDTATHYELAREKYALAGRELPRIVFWNLRGAAQSFPVSSNEQGVVMLAGYSPSLLKAIVGGKEINPLTVMLDIIRAERYDRVKAPADI